MKFGGEFYKILFEILFRLIWVSLYMLKICGMIINKMNCYLVISWYGVI